MQVEQEAPTIVKRHSQRAYDGWVYHEITWCYNHLS